MAFTSVHLSFSQLLATLSVSMLEFLQFSDQFRCYCSNVSLLKRCASHFTSHCSVFHIISQSICKKRSYFATAIDRSSHECSFSLSILLESGQFSQCNIFVLLENKLKEYFHLLHLVDGKQIYSILSLETMVHFLAPHLNAISNRPKQMYVYFFRMDDFQDRKRCKRCFVRFEKSGDSQ